MVRDNWSDLAGPSRIGSIELRLAWEVEADAPYERLGFASTGKGSTAERIAVRTISGEGWFQFAGGQTAICTTGQVLIFERKNLLSYGTQSNWHYWWFKYSAVTPGDLLMCRPFEARFETTELAMNHAIQEKLRHPSIELRAHASALFASLLYGWLADWHSQQCKGTGGKTVWNIVEMMHRRLESNLTVAEMAKEACLSPRRLNQMFQEAFGRSPKQHYDHLRFERASALLREGASTVSEVAGQLGFQDPYYFSRWYAAKAGIPPSKAIRQNTRA